MGPSIQAREKETPNQPMCRPRFPSLGTVGDLGGQQRQGEHFAEGPDGHGQGGVKETAPQGGEREAKPGQQRSRRDDLQGRESFSSH